MRAEQNPGSWSRRIPADQYSPRPVPPRKEPLHAPAALGSPQVAAILRLEFPRGPVWCDQVHAILLEGGIEPTAVRYMTADQGLEFSLQHVEVETQVHQRDRMMIGRMWTHRER